MSFPIPVNMTVSGDEPIQMTVQGDVAISCSLDIRVVPRTYDEYAGPYSVTPSEETQTIETDGKLMAGDVSVEAIPSDYVGSSVPRKTSEDLTASGPTVTAPAGYYNKASSLSVGYGSARVNYTSITANPTISVSRGGKITASVSKVQSVSPQVTAGYVSTGTAGNVSVAGRTEQNLTTQAAKTITPTETEQTAVAAQKFTTGEVKVGAIPSNYVGSGVPTQAAQTITPTATDQTIASGTYLTGAHTIKGDANLIAENIKKDVVLFNVTGTYEGGGGTLTTKTITQNGTYNAEDDGADGYSSVTVSVPQGVVIPSGFAFYNGYLLPEVKDLGDGYDYWWIRANGSTGNFDLIRGKSQWYVSSNSGLNAWSVAFANNTTLGSHQYSIPMDANEQSTTASDWGEVTVSYAATYGTGNNRKPIFTNVDIMIQGQSNICLRHGFAVVPNLP